MYGTHDYSSQPSLFFPSPILSKLDFPGCAERKPSLFLSLIHITALLLSFYFYPTMDKIKEVSLLDPWRGSLSCLPSISILHTGLASSTSPPLSCMVSHDANQTFSASA